MRFQLGDYVPYLLNRAGVELSQALGRELERYGLSLPFWRVLAALLVEGEQRLGDLARLTSMELSTLSRIAATMEVRGLIRRRRSGADARAVLATLTEEGRRVAEEVLPLARGCETAAIAGMSEDEVRTLKGLLHRVYGNVVGGGDIPALQTG